MSAEAREVVKRMVADRGPMPDHLVRDVAKRLARATPTTQAPAKKPA